MDYSKGKIYKLTGNGKTYYGSTIQELQARHYHHKNNSSFTIKELGNNFIISLVEEYPCKTKKELIEREMWWINNNECVNNNTGKISTGTDMEKAQRSAYMKDYRNNKELKQKIKLHKIKRDIYNMIPTTICSKLDKYIIDNPNKTINQIITELINPSFLS
jgi:predicted RNA-binding protein YlxR (DUF448 family)